MKRKKKLLRPRVALLLGSLLLPILGCGCKSYLAFGTATKFGLDITQKADQTIEVSMGYRRSEMASIPVAPEGDGSSDASDTDDAYSVLGRFNVTYGDPWKTGADEGLHLKQFFATGMAARKAAENPEMRRAFGEAAGEVKAKQEGATK
jgi:hypothetical protein